MKIKDIVDALSDPVARQRHNDMGREIPPRERQIRR